MNVNVINLNEVGSIMENEKYQKNSINLWAWERV